MFVTDNDASRELTLNWGYLAHDDPFWEQGEGYLNCSGGTCTPGPAEELFYYEDGRSFNFSDEIEEYWPAHFMVTRRAQDTGKTSTFVVRVEHDRGWEIPRHADWPTHPVSGKHYKEFPLTLTGDQRTVVGGIEILDNGLIDPENWMYSAQIKPLGDTDGNPLTAGQEAQYWTATGRCPLVPSESHKVQVDITNVTPEPVVEGQQVTFTIHRNRGNPLEPLTVHLRTWEPNRRMADGTNHTEQIHDLTFPALSMTSDWVEYVTQTMALTVTTEDAPKSETRDVLRAEMFRRECDLYQNYDHHRFKNEVHDRRVEIEDNDRPTITLSADKRAATEGETGFGEQVGAQPKVGMRAQKSGKGPISSVVDGCL